MNEAPRSSTGAHAARRVIARIDPDDCFWTLASREQAGSWRGRRTRLQYALEGASGIAAEDLAIAWVAAGDGQVLVVGCERTVLRGVVEAGAARASPRSSPDWLGAHALGESTRLRPHELDLLRDPALARIRRRSSVEPLIWIAMLGLLLASLLYGAERRIQTAQDAARRWTLTLRQSGESSVRPAPGRPWELAMLGELRQLRELGAAETHNPAHAPVDADQAMGLILARWPRSERLWVDRLVVTEATLNITLRADSVDVLRFTQDALAPAIERLPGWEMRPIGITSGKDAFQASIQAGRTSGER